MKKTGEDEETKTKSNPESKLGFSLDMSKYQNFIEEVVKNN